MSSKSDVDWTCMAETEAICLISCCFFKARGPLAVAKGKGYPLEWKSVQENKILAGDKVLILHKT